MLIDQKNIEDILNDSQLRLPFRHLCQRKCCSTTMWTNYVDPLTQQSNKLLVPLKDVNIKGILEAGHATLDVQLTYINAGDDNPIECTFEFPLDQQTVVSKLIAQIDDKVIEARVTDKSEAKMKYDDAIASGNTAVYAERD